MPICVRIESGFWKSKIDNRRSCMASLYKRRMKVRLNLKLDEPCISNPKSETVNWTVRDARSNSIFRISDLRCRVRPISNLYRAGSLFLLLHNQLHRALNRNPDLAFGTRNPAVALQCLLLLTKVFLKIRLRVYLQPGFGRNRWSHLHKRPSNITTLILMTEVLIKPPDAELNHCEDDDCDGQKPFERGQIHVRSLVALWCWFVGHIALCGVAFGS